MLVIFKNLPQRISLYQMEQLLTKTINSAFLFGRGRLVSINMLQGEDLKGVVHEYQCQASIEPDAAARRVIKLLNGKHLHGATLQVSPYVLRSWQNDRRNIAQRNVRNSDDARIVSSNRRRSLKWFPRQN